MWQQFFLENIHFAIDLFLAVTFFAIAWLHIDAWIERKNPRDMIRILGFLSLSLSFVFQAGYLESSLFTGSGLELSGTPLFVIFRLTGYLLIILSLVIDPLPKKPDLKPQPSSQAPHPLVAAFPFSVSSSLTLLLPLLSFFIALLYLRKATFGLERHLFKVSVGFFALFLAEACLFLKTFQSTTNASLFNLTLPFGPIWYLQNTIYFISFIILSIWVGFYLVKRMQSQLFFSFIVSILVIFLIVTIGFSAILLKNFEAETLSRLNSDVKILQFSLESKKSEQQSTVISLSQDGNIIKAVLAKDKSLLDQSTGNFLSNKKITSILVTDNSAVVLSRADDQERVGDSLSSHALIKQALEKKVNSNYVSKDGIIAPEISIQSASPILNGEEVIGVVLIEELLDNAFLDGLKTQTSLESGIFAKNRLSVTTLTLDDKTRPLGLNSNNLSLASQDNFLGPLTINSTPYFVSVIPLKDIKSETVAQLFVAISQSSVINTAARAIQLTYQVSILLICLSLIPSYFISRHLSKQISPN